jgi:hypothetical protein
VISDAGRVALRLGDFPAGSTLERTIWGYIIRQEVFYGGNTGVPRAGGLAFGVIVLPVSAGTPTVDPVSSPASDWLWAGLSTIEVLQIKSATVEEYRCMFTSPREQLETQSRRHNGSGESHRVWFVSQPLSILDSQFPQWRAATYGSVLYSELSP